MRKVLLGICLAMGFLFCNVQEMVYAAEQKTDLDTPPASYRGEDELSIDSIEKSGIPRQRSTATLETSYRSPYITSVKNQGSYGTCWAFSLIAASEASMIKHRLATSDVDLSEWQLAYFLAHSVTDPLGGTKGDYLTIKGDEYLNAGANQQLATFRVANWYGLVDEETAPYTTIRNDSTATLPDEAAYSKDVAHLENAYWVSMKDKDIIKQLIKEYGACGTSYCSDNQYYNQTNLYNTDKEVATYCPDNVSCDHGITIVGWDDAYSRENFNEENRPESDGAWYCKNSWGSGWSKEGYFWISYEDVPLSNGVGFFYDYGTKDNYEHNYQYDGGAWGVYYSQCAYEANMYQAKGNECLKSVGFYTRNAKYKCTVSVYKNCEDGKPTSGDLVVQQEADQLYAGFHTVELENPVSLRAGDTFSVVIRQTTEAGEYPEISVDSSTDDSWCTNTSAALDGQSFISTNGSYWFDISAADKNGNRENCRIKAYTDDVVMESVSLDYSGISLMTGQEKQLTVSLKPSNIDDVALEWTSDNEAVAAVSGDGKVIAKGYGIAEITCSVVGQESVRDTCKVSVTNYISDISLNETDINMKPGEKKTLTATVKPSLETTMGYYWSSDNKEVALVDSNGEITAVADGTAKVSCIAKDGSGKKAVCQVTVSNVEANPPETVLPETPAPEEQTIIHAKGKILSDSITKAKYKVTKSGSQNGTVEYISPASKVLITNIPAQVKIDGVIYKVTAIRANAFKNNKILTKVIIGKNVKTIGTGAFYGCSRLTTVTMGANVTTIKDKAFYKCSSLIRITIPAKVSNIGKQAFYNCKNLKKITIKTSKLSSKRVGSKAFKGIHSKAVIKVPKKKYKSYQTLLRARGIGRKVKVTR